MAFDLPPELAELQATVRKLAQQKVAPRAREIDVTATYPQDLFDLFRDTGLLGLVIPEEYGGSGAGILGLTVAMEEVATHLVDWGYGPPPQPEPSPEAGIEEQPVGEVH